MFPNGPIKNLKTITLTDILIVYKRWWLYIFDTLFFIFMLPRFYHGWEPQEKICTCVYNFLFISWKKGKKKLMWNSHRWLITHFMKNTWKQVVTKAIFMVISYSTNTEMKLNCHGLYSISAFVTRFKWEEHVLPTF